MKKKFLFLLVALALLVVALPTVAMAYPATGSIGYKGHCKSSFNTTDARYSKTTAANSIRNFCSYTWYGQTSKDPGRNPYYGAPPAHYSGIFVGGSLESQPSMPYGYVPYTHDTYSTKTGTTYLRITYANPGYNQYWGTEYMSAKGTFSVRV